MHRLTYYLFFLFFCFLPIFSANAAKKHTKKDNKCFPELSKEYGKLRQTIRKIERQVPDNYLYILPVYNVNYPLDTTSNAWKKLTSVLNKTIEEIDYAEAKDSSYCPTIAEIYKMKGIALFYQKQYQLAYQAFEIIVVDYPDSDSWIEAYIWLTRASIHLSIYEKTDFFLEEIEKHIDTASKDVKVYFHNIAAEYYIQVKDYKNALAHLTKSIHIGSPLNTRLSFIAAQVSEQLKCYRSAFTYYDNVFQKLFVNSLMKSYSKVHRHLCEKTIEKQVLDSIAEQQWKEFHPIPKDFEPTIVESYQDSSFFGRSYPYYFSDYASMFFLDETLNDWLNEELYNEDEYEYFDGEEDEESRLSEEMWESIFENWESIAIHIPKTDFSKMQDTIYLPLIDNASNYELPYFGAVVSRFGWRRYRYHYGIDLKGSTGDSIYCVFDGVVRIAVRNKTYGNVIIIRHYNGLETFYAHCSKLLVAQNQEVKAGELIGLIGNTGRSKGSHLHFETRYKGTAFNPEHMIDFENKKLRSDTLVLTKETFNYKNSHSSSSSASGTKYHRVKSGETLSTIARRYKTSVSNLKKMNGLKSDMIREGQRLRVP